VEEVFDGLGHGGGHFPPDSGFAKSSPKERSGNQHWLRL
jgi:hypothetical protein